MSKRCRVVPAVPPVVAGTGRAHDRARQRGGAPAAPSDDQRAPCRRAGPQRTLVGVVRVVGQRAAVPRGRRPSRWRRCGARARTSNCSSAACGGGATSPSRRRRRATCGARPRTTATVRPGEAGLRARDVWSPLPPSSTIDGGRASVRPASTGWTGPHGPSSTQLPIDPPAYLPVIHPTQGGRGRSTRLLGRGGRRSQVGGRVAAAVRAFLGRALGVHARRRIAHEDLAPHRRDHPGGHRLRGHAGARPSWLDRRVPGSKCHVRGGWSATVVPWRCGTRLPPGKVVRLTPKGEKAQRRFLAALHATEGAWRTRFGDDAVQTSAPPSKPSSATGRSLPPRGAGARPTSRQLARQGASPRDPPAPPMVLHRGGYPDGS